jgi:hypothetical protein
MVASTSDPRIPWPTATLDLAGVARGYPSGNREVLSLSGATARRPFSMSLVDPFEVGIMIIMIEIYPLWFCPCNNM